MERPCIRHTIQIVTRASGCAVVPAALQFQGTRPSALQFYHTHPTFPSHTQQPSRISTSPILHSLRTAISLASSRQSNLAKSVLGPAPLCKSMRYTRGIGIVSDGRSRQMVHCLHCPLHNSPASSPTLRVAYSYLFPLRSDHSFVSLP